MQTIVTEVDLRNAILQLESRQAEESAQLKVQVLAAVDNLKPINLIKKVFTDAVESADLHHSLVNTSIGLSAGYISKMLFQSISHSPIRKILGTALMFGIKNLIARNPEVVNSGTRTIFKTIRILMRGKAKKTVGN